MTYSHGGTPCRPVWAEGPTAQKLDDVLALRGLVEELDATELPHGSGRD